MRAEEIIERHVERRERECVAVLLGVTVESVEEEWLRFPMSEPPPAPDVVVE